MISDYYFHQKRNRLRPHKKSISFLPQNIQLIIIWGRLSISELETRLYNRSFFNLTKSFKLTYSQASILSLGTKFVPTPKPLKFFNYKFYLNKFIRNCRLYYEFGKDDNFNPNDFRIPNPHYIPPPAPFDIEQIFVSLERIFIDHNNYLNSDLSSFIETKKRNLSNNKWKALLQLINNDKIIIKPADKNLGLVLMDKEDYNAHCLKILNSKDFISLNKLEALKLLHNCKNNFIQLLSFLKKGNLKWFNYFTSNCKLVFNHFYGLPKLHKPTLSFRPIVSSHNYLFQIFSKFIAKLFNKFMFNHPLFLKNSTSLIPHLESIHFNNINQAFVVTGDVESLYPSIPIPDCINAIKYFIHDILSQTDIIHPFTPKTIILLITLFLNNNYISFEDYYFQQIQGIAMGNASSVQLANIFMFYIEKNLPSSQHIILHKRYIDDIILIWNGPLDKLNSFLNVYQNLHKNIRINFKISNYLQSNEFLDLHIQIRNSKLYLSTHQKSLNKYLYIPNNSFHSFSQKKGFIIGELYRYIRNSSNALAFIITKNLFYERLRARGYKINFLNRIFNSINYSLELRNKFLFPQQQQSHHHHGRPHVLGIPHNPSLYISVRELLTLILPHLNGIQLNFLNNLIVVKLKNPSLLSLLVKPPHPPSKPEVITEELSKQAHVQFDIMKKILQNFVK